MVIFHSYVKLPEGTVANSEGWIFLSLSVFCDCYLLWWCLCFWNSLRVRLLFIGHNPKKQFGWTNPVSPWLQSIVAMGNPSEMEVSLGKSSMIEWFSSVTFDSRRVYRCIIYIYILYYIIYIIYIYIIFYKSSFETVGQTKVMTRLCECTFVVCLSPSRLHA